MPYRYSLIKILLLLAVLAFAPPGRAEVDYLPEEIAGMVKKHRINAKRIGLVLQRADGLVLATHQAQRPFNPASVAKVITSLAAMDILGVDFKWQTGIAKTGSIKNGVLHGDLYIIGGGDPYITLDNFLYLLNKLRNRGIKEIRGDVIIDDSFFLLPPHNPGSFDGASTRPYNVGGGGMVVNFKSQRIVFSVLDNKTHIYTDPPNTNFQLDNRVKLSAGRCRNWRGKIRERLSGDSKQITLRLSGSYSKHCKEQDFYLSALSHPAYVAGIFGGLWQRLGGTWSGQWKQGIAPKKNLQTLLVHDSPALPLVLSAMNKFSNNVIARNVFLSLATKQSTPPPYKPEQAHTVVRQWLTEKGVPEIVLENGSGLSRKSRITPRQMTDLLEAIWHHPYQSEIIASLPVMGKDGTLRKRVKNKAIIGQAHLKTGNLSGIIAISGFFRDQKGRHFLMTLFSERQSRRSIQGLQEDIIDWVYHLET